MSVFKMKAKAAVVRDQAPAGTHQARVVSIIDLGTHEEDFQGKKKDLRKLFIVWELTEEKNRPTIGREFTMSFGKKAALRKFIEQWSGKSFAEGQEFDITSILGKGCLLSITHKTSQNGENTYAKVEGVAQLAKGMKPSDPEHKPFCWEIAVGATLPDFDWLPFIFGVPVKDVIVESPEWKAAAAGQEPPPPVDPEQGDAFEGGEDMLSEEIPF